MGRYTGKICPACNEMFKDSDNIVVCPDCGAPQHRECFQKNGLCFYNDRHQELENDYKNAIENKVELEEEPHKCSRCGTVNNKDTIFCQVCGTPLSENIPIQNPKQPLGSPFFIGYNPYTTPLGGSDPEELIDEIETKHYGTFVGNNSHYYIPRFKSISKKENGAGFNFAAFFFPYIWFFYRKMYLFGIISTVIFIALQIPSLLSLPNIFTAINQMNTNGTLSDLSLFTIQPKTIADTLSLYISFLSTTIKIIISVFANKLYFNFAKDKINQTKLECSVETQIPELLLRKGRTDVAPVIVAIAIMIAVEMGIWVIKSL